MDRRKFIGSSTALASGMMLGAQPLFANGQPGPNDILQIGVIGTGGRGSGLMRIMNQFPHFKIVAACDILPFRLDAAMEYADPKAKAYDDYRKLLENKDLDGIVIASPLYLHHSMVRDAMDRDIHIYCEKTMTYEREHALDLVQQVGQMKKVFQVGHQYRYLPLYHKVAGIIREGWLGDITNIYVQWNRNGDWRRPVPDPKFERIINWRMYKEYSGGLTAELHSHQIDYINWVFDSHPQRVVGFGGIDYWKDGRETFDNVNTILEYPGGMKVNAIALTANSHEGYLFKFKGSKGTLELGVKTAKVYFEPPNEKEKATVDGVTGASAMTGEKEQGLEIEGDHTEENKGWEGTHFAIAEFYDCVANGKEPVSNVKTGATAALSVRMAIDALRSSTMQEWKPEYDEVLG